MPDNSASAGILSLAVYVPRTYHDADFIASQCDTPADIIRTKLGWRQKNVPGPGDGTVAMGLKAARKAIHYAGLAPRDIDLVIWSGEEIKEYRNWPVGRKLAELTRNAWSFDAAALRHHARGAQAACDRSAPLRASIACDRLRYRNADLIHIPTRGCWMFTWRPAGGLHVERDCPVNDPRAIS
jgi:3-oxoacyl-[acyl-carrier-protein] synthase-3